LISENAKKNEENNEIESGTLSGREMIVSNDFFICNAYLNKVYRKEGKEMFPLARSFTSRTNIVRIFTS
jgi:hypothetical protein